ncbi:MAG: hypothetical protein AAF417_21885 [Pseudomonadota bacterium]
MLELLEAFSQWLLDVFLFVPRYVFQQAAEAAAEFVEGLPVPDFITNWGQTMADIGGEFWWLASAFAIPEGFAIVLSAFLLRFFIRRIPVIG